jgi:hypothetical protein
MQTFSLQSDIHEDSVGKKIRLAFTGYLTLQNAKEIKSALLQHGNDFRSADLHAHDVEGIDVSFIQVIEAFRKATYLEGKQVKISLDLPYDLKTLLANAGISYPNK